MKCLCGFTQKPDALQILEAHVDDCLSNGFLSNLSTEPAIVWRNREFVVTDEPKAEDRVMKTVAIPAGRIPISEEALTPRVNARFTKEEVVATKTAPKKKAAPKKKK